MIGYISPRSPGEAASPFEQAFMDAAKAAGATVVSFSKDENIDLSQVTRVLVGSSTPCAKMAEQLAGPRKAAAIGISDKKGFRQTTWTKEHNGPAAVQQAFDQFAAGLGNVAIAHNPGNDTKGDESGKLVGHAHSDLHIDADQIHLDEVEHSSATFDGLFVLSDPVAVRTETKIHSDWNKNHANKRYQGPNYGEDRKTYYSECGAAVAALALGMADVVQAPPDLSSQSTPGRP